MSEIDTQGDTSSTPPKDDFEWPVDSASYEKIGQIGAGGCATIWKCRCLTNDAIVAVKIIDIEEAKQDVNGIMKELVIMQSCDHPNIVAHFCSFTKDHELWIVMDYLAGGSLYDVMKFRKDGLQDERLIATVLLDVLKGLAYFHEKGFIHRDIKASNVLVGQEKGIQLADFGVSTSNISRKRGTTFVGSPCWMAPEVMEEVKYDHKVDIWSFGITALELANGYAPFAKLDTVQVMVKTMDVSEGLTLSAEERKKFSKDFRKMVESCLRRDPSERPEAVSLLKHAFFKNTADVSQVVQEILEGVPDLENRFLAYKRKRGAGESNKAEEEEANSNKNYLKFSGWSWEGEIAKAKKDIEDEKAEAGASSNSSSENQSSSNASSSNSSEVKKGRFTHRKVADQENPEQGKQREVRFKSVDNSNTVNSSADTISKKPKKKKSVQENIGQIKTNMEKHVEVLSYVIGQQNIIGENGIGMLGSIPQLDESANVNVDMMALSGSFVELMQANTTLKQEISELETQLAELQKERGITTTNE